MAAQVLDDAKEMALPHKTSKTVAFGPSLCTLKYRHVHLHQSRHRYGLIICAICIYFHS